MAENKKENSYVTTYNFHKKKKKTMDGRQKKQEKEKEK